MPKSFLLIDGSNLYHRLKEQNVKDLINFRYDLLASFIRENTLIAKQIYYVGAIREEASNPKSKILLANQSKLLSKLRSYDYLIELGYILKNQDYREKGVDVKIATDILVGAYENLYDKLFLVSSDTDLIPAIQKAKEKGKHIEYVGFSHKPSLALIKNCSSSRLLRPEDLAKINKQP